MFAQCLTSCGPFVCRVVVRLVAELSDDWLPGGGSPAECVAKSKYDNMNYVKPKKTRGFGLSVKERRYLKNFFQNVSMTPGNRFMKIIAAQKNRKKTGDKAVKTSSVGKINNSLEKRLKLASLYRNKFENSNRRSIS